MPVRGLLEARFVSDEIGPAFAAAYAEALEYHQDFLVTFNVRKMSGEDLIAAENRSVVSIVRFCRRLWTDLVAKGHDPRSLSVSILPSGRPMTALDPHWPPEFTTADLARIADGNVKKAEVPKMIKAHNRQSARTSRNK